MGTDNDLCTWSDLPHGMCAHCGPAQPPTLAEQQAAATVTYDVANIRPRPANPDLSARARALLGAGRTPIHIETPTDLHGYLTQLAWPIASSQRYELAQTNRDGSVTRVQINHPSAHLPLISQLWEAGNQNAPTDEGARPGYASKPTARVDALDAFYRIDSEAAKWVRVLGHDDPEDTLGILRRLNGLAAGIGHDHKPGALCCDWHAIEQDARAWWVQSRVLTGWDSSAWRPDSTCPPCGARGTLRVKLLAKTAMCVDCREVWTEDTIGMLAQHISDEAEAGRFDRRAEHVPCQQVDDDDQVARIMLCPDCGSRRCVKAQDQVVTRLTDHRRGGRMGA